MWQRVTRVAFSGAMGLFALGLLGSIQTERQYQAHRGNEERYGVKSAFLLTDAEWAAIAVGRKPPF